MCGKVILTSCCEGSLFSCRCVEGVIKVAVNGKTEVLGMCCIVLTCFPLEGVTGGLEANTIYISNLPESVTEDSLAALLSETANIKV